MGEKSTRGGRYKNENGKVRQVETGKCFSNVLNPL